MSMLDTTRQDNTRQDNTRQVKSSKDKTREEDSDHKRKEGRGQGRTSMERAFGVRACRVAVLLFIALAAEKEQKK